MILAVDCGKLSFLFNILGYLFKLVKYIIPAVLIVLIIIDLFKVVLNPDDKLKKDVGSKTAKRLIYAVILFLVPTLVALLFRITVGNNNIGGYDADWKSCAAAFFN